MRESLPSGTAVEIARPEGEPSAGLVVIPDIMGLRPLFDDHVARLSADNGWAVAAIEPWPGREDLSLEAKLQEPIGGLADRILPDSEAAADVLAVETVGVVGFCMGGMFAMLASASARFARAVSFYGMIRVPERWRADGQVDPVDAITGGDPCPVLALIGTADPWTPADQVEELERAGVEVVRYEGADHGFAHDPSRPAHRPDDAADAWRRAIEFLTP